MRVWHEFLEEFGALTPGEVRDGCAPRCYEHATPPDRAIVLAHGLTDSPHFMDAIGRRFHAAGWNVYLPLLHMHGLHDPQGMLGVSLAEWKRNIAFAVDAAGGTRGARISIGGLSTGGSLGVYEALRAGSRVDGALFLFAAALRLAAPRPSRLARGLRRTGLSGLGRLIGRRSRFEGPLVGANPYRYDRMDLGGVRQLLALMKEIEALLVARGPRPLEIPVFAAHSESDLSADFSAVRAFVDRVPAERAELFAIGKAQGVSHASLVLEEDVRDAEGRVLEARNPLFDDMMKRALTFADAHG